MPLSLRGVSIINPYSFAKLANKLAAFTLPPLSMVILNATQVHLGYPYVHSKGRLQHSGTRSSRMAA